MSGLNVEQIAVLNDNYIYLLTCTETGKIAVVDPAVHAPVIEVLGNRQLDYIFNTHHHADHTGGNLALKEKYGCTIIGAKNDAARIPGIDQTVSEGDVVALGVQKAQVYETPGHTLGHIIYHFESNHALFCGDTLFAGGCGRLFEGSPEQMFQSLQKIKAMPDDTQVYCAHEYTLQNYKFLHQAAPENTTVQKRLSAVEQMRAAHQRTVPSLLAEEKKSNLFLTAPNTKAFAELRKAKDNF